SFTQQMQAGLANLSSAWDGVKNIAEATIGAMQAGISGVTAGIMGAIDGTTTWGQVFADVAKQIIASLIQIVLQWIVNETIVEGLRWLFAAKEIALGQVQANAWREAAYYASVASYGAAAGIGAAALIAGYASTAGLGAVGTAGRAISAGSVTMETRA